MSALLFWIADRFPRVYLFWDQHVYYPVMSRVVRLQRAWLSRGGRCWPRAGFATGDLYCGRHGRAAGWPCAAVLIGWYEDGQPIMLAFPQRYSREQLEEMFVTSGSRSAIWTLPAEVAVDREDTFEQ